MRIRLALLTGLAWMAWTATGAAQTAQPGPQPPAKQSAPSESGDAPGHDSQTGKPATGELTKGQPGSGGDREGDRTDRRGTQPATGTGDSQRR